MLVQTSEATEKTHMDQAFGRTGSPIPAEMERLAIKGKQLHELGDLLYQRLESVLTPALDQVGDQGLGAIQPERSHLTVDLVVVHDTLDSLETRLRSLVDRIEL